MNKRSLLLAAVLCNLPFAAVQAADLSAPAPYQKAPVIMPPPALYNWSGFYVGGHLGGAWTSANWTDPVSGLGDNPTGTGFIGGGQVGYNYQTGPWVLGIEGDFSGTNLSASDTDVAGFTHSTSTYWTSTVTGRVGYAVNRLLFYAKGGVAFANERNAVTSPFGAVSSGTSTPVGWTAGGGVEYALDHNWSARVEYDYLGLGSESISGPVAGALPGSVDLNIQRVTAGINYRF
jgi:outer membrane immunogenic protein